MLASRSRSVSGKVWEADPLLCPNCGGEMRIVGLINERGVIERILRHLGLWDPPGEEFVRAGSDPWLDEDPFADCEQEPVIMAS
ncbi:MAG: hypothetical protein P9M08_12670 [Candidatus Erginobacter occultus]|nr:hypothetical protein [Candidatus Erginobacter occultus]